MAYAITQTVARQILYEIGLKDFNAAYDIILKSFCQGDDGRGSHRCLTLQPSIFQHHRPAGPMSADSDISDHGPEWRESAHSDNLRWSVRLNAEELMKESTDFVDQFPDE